MAIAQAAAALEASPLGEWMRSGGYAYAAVNVAHLFGLALLVGPVLLLDLRVLGAGRRFPLPDTVQVLSRIAAAGVLLAVASGVALFAADALALSGNALMRAKLVLVLLALGNVLAFHAWAGRGHARWPERAPAAPRACAAVSLLLWPLVVVAGRMIAYV